MLEILPALVTAGVGVLLLVLLLLVVLRHVRRLTRARGTFRTGLTEGMTPLRALMNSRRPGRE